MYTDKIDVIKTDETTETISENKDKKVSFTSISLSNSAVMLEEKSSGLFTADSIVSIINRITKIYQHILQKRLQKKFIHMTTL